MRTAARIFASLLALSAVSARAADTPPKPADESVKLSPVALPIVVDGRIANYVFVTVQVDLTPSADVIGLQAKEPDFRDALVRDGHRTPFVLANDYNRLDEGKLKAALYRDAVTIAGPRAIKGVEVLSQTAQHFVRPPRPATPAPAAQAPTP